MLTNHMDLSDIAHLSAPLTTIVAQTHFKDTLLHKMTHLYFIFNQTYSYPPAVNIAEPNVF